MFASPTNPALVSCRLTGKWRGNVAHVASSLANTRPGARSFKRKYVAMGYSLCSPLSSHNTVQRHKTGPHGLLATAPCHHSALPQQQQQLSLLGWHLHGRGHPSTATAVGQGLDPGQPQLLAARWHRRRHRRRAGCLQPLARRRASSSTNRRRSRAIRQGRQGVQGELQWWWVLDRSKRPAQVQQGAAAVAVVAVARH